ncbi:hypothetical protein NP493_14g00029 [Ridgeia piscesae]|uniref:Uncharacterized protein n=1 Tax=Ridgeia piscesae TaxID=27915 RepID=A0AAD9UL02_RIDPI|nr:hypothetical protein NP493_14g00029 [Ridgeia piscesae]
MIIQTAWSYPTVCHILKYSISLVVVLENKICPHKSSTSSTESHPASCLHQVSQHAVSVDSHSTSHLRSLTTGFPTCCSDKFPACSGVNPACDLSQVNFRLKTS